MSRLTESGFGKQGINKKGFEKVPLHETNGEFRIKCGSVENVESDGIHQGNGDLPQLWQLFKAVKEKTNFNRVTENEIIQGDTTRVIFVPVDGIELPPIEASATQENSRSGSNFFQKIQKLLTGTTSEQQHATPELWSRGDVAICFTYRAENASASGKSGQLNGIAIVNSAAAAVFDRVLRDQPEKLFEMAHLINKKQTFGESTDKRQAPIRQFDGKAATIAPGSRVIIMENNMFGGPLSRRQESVPFAEGFVAN